LKFLFLASISDSHNHRNFSIHNERANIHYHDIAFIRSFNIGTSAESQKIIIFNEQQIKSS